MMPSISYALTAHNEHQELDTLLTILLDAVTNEDEIVVQIDTTATQEVRDVILNHGLIATEFPLNKDFATFKNNLKGICKKDYIVFLDADEVVTVEFCENLKEILRMNPEVDMYLVPRWNTVDGLTEDHAKRWGWKVDELGRINFPDYQTRVCKNVPKIEWHSKVHERLKGYTTMAPLPDEMCMFHPKTVERQEKQNELYRTI